MVHPILLIPHVNELYDVFGHDLLLLVARVRLLHAPQQLLESLPPLILQDHALQSALLLFQVAAELAELLDTPPELLERVDSVLDVDEAFFILH